jgi:hypothetical protein
MQCAREIPALEDRNLNAVHMYGLAGIEIERFAGTTDVSDWRRELDVVLAGPCAQQCDEIRAFITNGRSIETDRFLKPADVGAVLETEPRFCCDGNLHQQDRMSIDQVALNLDSFLEDAGVSLANLWDDLAVRCGQRMCVIAGLGLNGRAILRMPPPRLHPLNGRLRSHDDRSDAQPSCAPRVDGFKALDPRRHFVLVTPTGHAALSNRLSQQGFSADDWTSLAAMAAGPSANNINAAGVGIPSGCR